jgi:hypothetical protein
MIDIVFTVSRFYTDTEFLNKCNEYYNKFNLSFTIEKNTSNPKFKNNWKLQLRIINGNYISFNGEVEADEVEIEIGGDEEEILYPDCPTELIENIVPEIKFMSSFADE